MHECTTCGRTFDSRQKLGGHKGSHSRGEEYRARRRGKSNTCVVCQVDTKNAKYCSQVCYHSTFDSTHVVARNGDILDVTRGELAEYRKNHLDCEICGRTETTMSNITGGRVNQLSVDHDHETLIFRGLLCSVCNRQLGWYENNKTSVAQYLDS